MRFPSFGLIDVNVFGASRDVFMCFWWFEVRYYGFPPRSLGVLLLCPLSIAACLGASVLVETSYLLIAGRAPMPVEPPPCQHGNVNLS